MKKMEKIDLYLGNKKTFYSQSGVEVHSCTHQYGQDYWKHELRRY